MTSEDVAGPHDPASSADSVVPTALVAPAERGRRRRPVLRGGLRAVATVDGLVLMGGPSPVTVPDTPAVHRLLRELADGLPVQPTQSETRLALARVVAGSLTEPHDVVVARAAARRAARVLVDAPGGPATTAVELLLASGLTVTSATDRATHALVVGAGEVARSRVDDWVRRGVPHLLVVQTSWEVTIGPYVAIGRTCCVHCLDAGAAERDPRRRGLIAQVATATPVSPGSDPALLTAALAWAVRDLAAALEGGRPSTWSATVTLRAETGSGVSSRRREWRRHPDCGCAWADSLAAPQVG